MWRGGVEGREGVSVGVGMSLEGKGCGWVGMSVEG